MPSSEREKLDLLPQASKQKEDIPPPCSVAKYYPDVLLRNDGFNAHVAYTFDDFYAHGASILGNMVQMEVPGAVLQLIDDEQGERMINVLLLYDARRQLTNSFSLDTPGSFTFHQTPAGKRSILHDNPELWSFEGSLPNGRKVKFAPEYDVPLNYVADATKSEGAENRNLETPTMLVAYGGRKPGIVDYAYEHFMNPPRPVSLNTLPDDDIIDALMLIVKEVRTKWAKLLPDQELQDPEIELR